MIQSLKSLPRCGVHPGLPSVGRAASFALLLGLAACGSSSPTLYALAPVSGASSPGLLVASPIEVRLPTVAVGLDRDRIVLADEGYKLNVSTSDAWSESLSSQIAHVLAGELGQRLPGASLFVQNDVISGTPKAYVEMVVNRFARDPSGQAVLDAQVAVHLADADGAPLTKHVVLTTSGGAGTSGLVAALSTLLGQAADQIAAEIRALPPAPSAP